jgi:hypothetical protein
MHEYCATFRKKLTKSFGSWRTRDIDGDQFRQSKSSSRPDGVPPRDRAGSQRYSQHLPFQVFCCESGTHVVDPEQSYYQEILYRAGTDFHNVSVPNPAPVRGPESPCLDSTQAWFCRDLWTNTAKRAMKELDSANEIPTMKHALREDSNGLARRQPPPVDPDANAGSDYDAMPDSDVPLAEVPARVSIPNSVFQPARILVNPRCVTTYAGVSHTQLALDLFGPEREVASPEEGMGKYILEDWEGAPESFVCQEQRFACASGNQLWVRFMIYILLGRLEEGRQQKHKGGLDFPFMMN